jgi:limonene-1,2-epoxide hydrolase
MTSPGREYAFTDLLAAFAAAVVANDGAGLAALFTTDGIYADEFFGAHKGRTAIAVMLRRFHDTGQDYRWDFFDPVFDGSTGYARYYFSYRSLLPGCEDRPVVFAGIGCFQMEGGLIALYREAFDRGVALAQLDFPAERIKRVLQKAAATQNQTPEAQAHLARFAGE